VQTPRSKSLILDLYGAFVRDLGNWLPVADLITLMGDLGVDEPAVRSSVSRMSRAGLLVRRRIGDRVGYELSPRAERILEEGDLRIFTGTQPADAADGWVLVVFSVPEEQRDRRHQLRSRLTWLGFGSIGGGVWIAPARVEARALEAVEELGLRRYVDVFAGRYRGFDDLEALVARAWDLERLALRYDAFVAAAGPVLRRWRRDEADAHRREAFVDYVTLLHQWRTLPYLDPGLPPELLPAGWRGSEAAALFDAVGSELRKPAGAYVEAVMSAA
jgi:phenylacetic acid degradation operon negative regulatory protein